ncbi:MAG TPA: plastocyanin/azurin family copper-binding protein [Opitutaceae bacterium]|jgi:azurin|nr:plastocyanin/azurin family copper-binding protein [Opitutaceae bacterium]
MKTKYISTLLALTLIAVGCIHADPATGPVQTITISASDMLRFSVTEIDASPGQQLHVVLTNETNMPKDTMGHNWVLLTADEDPIAYATAALSAKDEGYLPKALADKVIASIAMLGPKETGEVTFKAPTVPGTYQYLCSCTGHSMAGMRGVLIVK